MKQTDEVQEINRQRKICAFQECHRYEQKQNQKDTIYYIHFRLKRFFFVSTYVKNIEVKLHISRQELRLWLFICCKTKLKKKFFFEESICVFYKIYIICRKKSFYVETFSTEKNFFTQKNINENVKNIYLISKVYFYPENVYVTNKI